MSIILDRSVRGGSCTGANMQINDVWWWLKPWEVLGKGKLCGGLVLEMLVAMYHLLQVPRIDGPEEGIFLDTTASRLFAR